MVLVVSLLILVVAVACVIVVKMHGRMRSIMHPWLLLRANSSTWIGGSVVRSVHSLLPPLFQVRICSQKFEITLLLLFF